MEENYNTIHKFTRSTIERCNATLKMRFRCLLKHRVLHYAPNKALKIIKSCVILHNLCIRNNIDLINEENFVNDDFGDLNVHDHEEEIDRVNLELGVGRKLRSRVALQLMN